jgi:hypothetical protein
MVLPNGRVMRVADLSNEWVMGEKARRVAQEEKAMVGIMASNPREDGVRRFLRARSA